MNRLKCFKYSRGTKVHYLIRFDEIPKDLISNAWYWGDNTGWRRGGSYLRTGEYMWEAPSFQGWYEYLLPESKTWKEISIKEFYKVVYKEDI